MLTPIAFTVASMADVRGPRLVLVARRPPFPLDNGARIRVHHLLGGLSREFVTTLVTYEHAVDSPDGSYPASAYEDAYPGVEVIALPGPAGGKRGRQALSLARPGSWTNGRYASAALADAVRRQLEPGRPCILHFEELGTAVMGPQSGALNVYGSHNVEHRVLGLTARTGSVPRRVFNHIEAWKVRAEERRVWRSMDICLAVSELDARAMTEGGARRVELCPNGSVPADRLPLPERAAGDPVRLLFVGSGGYMPYTNGLAWFVREALPRIRERVPVVFDVVGEPPGRRVHGEGVRYLGTVPSVEPHYSACDAVVVPVFEGSGTRLKVIEAMTLGRPVISTRLGAEGLPVSAGADYLQADDAGGFAAAVARVAEWSAGDRERMLASAREAVRELTWPHIVERLVELYRSELRARYPA
jgi:polysaccharide biosynthesis protein PslH